MRTLLVLALVVFTPPVGLRFAPVYIHSDDSVMQRLTNTQYKDKPGYDILYCVAESRTSAIIECVVHTPDDQLVLIDVQSSGFSL